MERGSVGRGSVGRGSVGRAEPSPRVPVGNLRRQQGARRPTRGRGGPAPQVILREPEPREFTDEAYDSGVEDHTPQLPPGYPDSWQEGQQTPLRFLPGRAITEGDSEVPPARQRRATVTQKSVTSAAKTGVVAAPEQ